MYFARSLETSPALKREASFLWLALFTRPLLLFCCGCVYVWYNISVSEDAHNIDDSLIPRPSLDLPAFIVSCKKQERDQCGSEDAVNTITYTHLKSNCSSIIKFNKSAFHCNINKLGMALATRIAVHAEYYFTGTHIIVPFALAARHPWVCLDGEGGT